MSARAMHHSLLLASGKLREGQVIGTLFEARRVFERPAIMSFSSVMLWKYCASHRDMFSTAVEIRDHVKLLEDEADFFRRERGSVGWR